MGLAAAVQSSRRMQARPSSCSCGLGHGLGRLGCSPLSYWDYRAPDYNPYYGLQVLQGGTSEGMGLLRPWQASPLSSALQSELS